LLIPSSFGFRHWAFIFHGNFELSPDIAIRYLIFVLSGSPYRLLVRLLLFTLIAPRVFAQIDPEPRQLIQVGYNQMVTGKSPIAGYAYYYWNQPEFVRSNLTLRLALAPVYLDSELGIKGALGENTDIGIGLAGGGFADSYSEVRRGNYLKSESFTGHGGEISANLYHLFNPGDRIPLNGILSVAAHQSFYETDADTAPGFQVPANQTVVHLRSGLRLGGREPTLAPDLAMEFSLWQETQFRTEASDYGFAGDRSLEGNSHLFWGRLLFIYTLEEWKHNLSFSLTGGGSINADRFNAFRLGAVMPLASEFPLDLPGYYFQELTAERFTHFNLQYSLPLDSKRRWNLTAHCSTAFVDYLSGLDQPGKWHTGAGGGVMYRAPSGSWLIMAGYAYGFDTIRSDGRGSSSIGFLCQFDLAAAGKAYKARQDPDAAPRSRGLFRIFN